MNSQRYESAMERVKEGATFNKLKLKDGDAIKMGFLAPLALSQGPY